MDVKCRLQGGRARLIHGGSGDTRPPEICCHGGCRLCNTLECPERGISCGRSLFFPVYGTDYGWWQSTPQALTSGQASAACCRKFLEYRNESSVFVIRRLDSSPLPTGNRIWGTYLQHPFNTPGTARKERSCAAKIAGLLGVKEFLEIDSGIFLLIGGSSLTNHLTECGRIRPISRAIIPNTYVPFRNANLLSIATVSQAARSADAVFIGVQSHGL